jgi:hypothetical protein
MSTEAALRFSIVFIVIGLYNIVFACLLSFFPESLFGLVGISSPFTELISSFLALAIGAFSLVYFLAVIFPQFAKPLIFLAFLSKIFPLLIVVYLIYFHQWSTGLLIFIVVNDIIWWIPLGRFLFRKTSV